MRGQRHWFQMAIQLRGSVIPAILPRTVICGLFGVLISLLHHYQFPVSQPALGSVIPSIVLGLLLVFRTNTAYERFWEGRKAWGQLVNTSRNLARQIWVAVPAHNSTEYQQKIAALKLLVAFAVCTKLHLRQQRVNAEVEVLVSTQQFRQLQDMNNPPLEVALWLGDYLQQQHARNYISSQQLTAMHELLNVLVDALGACERILKTPMPLAYAIHLKQLLIIYCLLLPFQLVGQLGWLTGFTVALVSFTLLGIEEIGLEIENPFGNDPNDLPIDTICATMLRNIEDLIKVGDTQHVAIDNPDVTLRA
ncbi:MAG: hypothetical protein NZ772_06240 [Cyanobacteria bacterium]|nr:hypothetical protein [Cyanobacteriota bacterium]MDW8200248.1 bestrophin family ion channel [Cyanobacteriota bacterium SKYGB_h_bin112]